MFKIRSSKMPLRLLRSFAANLLVCCPAFCLNRHFFIFGLRFPGLLCTAIVALTRSPRGFSKALAAYPLLLDRGEGQGEESIPSLGLPFGWGPARCTALVELAR